MLGILRRVFSFSDWNTHHPGAQPPGDMLDASFDAQNAKIAELETLIRQVLRSDGALANGIVSFDAMQPAFFRFFQAELDKAVEKLRFELSEQAKNATAAEKAAVLAADDAKIDLARAEIVRNALKSAENSAVAAESALFARAEAVSALIARSEDARTDFDDASSEAQAWADVSMAWAENMPDTIPPGTLAVMDVTGDHWSSRWWANYASQIVTAGLGVPGPVGPTGPQGSVGPAGPGVPVGGSTGQILTKSSVTDYATVWQSPTGVSDGDKGDIVVSGAGATWLFDSAVVTAAARALLDDASTGAMLGTLGGLPSSSYTAADVLAKLLTVDGAGSGLDADLLDGNSSAFFATASSVSGKLDASAYTAADVLAKIVTVDGTGSGLDADFLDGQSSAAFAAAVHSHAQSDITGLPAALTAKLDASAYTAADVLAKIKTVDGTTSGLDADLLDGNDSAFFATATSLSGKEPTIAAGTAAQYWQGTKTWQTLDKAAVGLANVDNTSDAAKPVSTAQAAADALNVLKAGDTMAGKLSTVPQTATSAGFNLAPASFTPSSLVDGDLFITTGGNFVYRMVSTTQVVANLAQAQTFTAAKSFNAATRFMSTTATPAGGATTANINFGTAQIGIYFGSGAPSITAVQGSLYLRTDGSSNVTRMYINTTGAAVWTAVNTVA